MVMRYVTANHLSLPGLTHGAWIAERVLGVIPSLTQSLASLHPPAPPLPPSEPRGWRGLLFGVTRDCYIFAAMPSKPIELPPKVAKTFVKHMRAFYSERSATKRDKIAGTPAGAVSAAERSQAAAAGYL
jgi:hypothetical protein